MPRPHHHLGLPLNLYQPWRKLGFLIGTTWVVVSVMWSIGKTIPFFTERTKDSEPPLSLGWWAPSKQHGRWKMALHHSQEPANLLSVHVAKGWSSRDLAPASRPCDWLPLAFSPGLLRVSYEQAFFCQQSCYLHTSHPSSLPLAPLPARFPRRSEAIGHSRDVGNTFILENAPRLTYLVTNMTHSCSRGAPPVDRVDGWGGHSNQKSPGLLVSWHSSCVCAGLAERRVEAEMLVAVMCVGRNAPVLSLRLSYARLVRWKPLPGTVCRASASLCTGWTHTQHHFFNRHANARVYTHTYTMSCCPEDLLITLSEGRLSDTRRADQQGYRTHVQDFPSCSTSTIFSLYLWLFFSHRGQRCAGGKLKGEGLSREGKIFLF